MKYKPTKEAKNANIFPASSEGSSKKSNNIRGQWGIYPELGNIRRQAIRNSQSRSKENSVKLSGSEKKPKPPAEVTKMKKRKGVDRVLDYARIIKAQREARKSTLKTVDSVRRYVANIVNDMRRGLILPSHANVILAGCRLLFEIIQAQSNTEIEKRIKMLEKLRAQEQEIENDK